MAEDRDRDVDNNDATERVRGYARAALQGIMAHASQYNLSVEEVSARVWDIAHEVEEAEFRPAPPAPPQPQQNPGRHARGR